MQGWESAWDPYYDLYAMHKKKKKGWNELTFMEKMVVNEKTYKKMAKADFPSWDYRVGNGGTNDGHNPYLGTFGLPFFMDIDGVTMHKLRKIIRGANEAVGKMGSMKNSAPADRYGIENFLPTNYVMKHFGIKDKFVKNGVDRHDIHNS